MMTIERIEKTDLLRLARLPAAEEVMLSDSFATIGKQDLLTTRKTALFCSRQCPGEVILRLFDLARRLRTSDLTFIGGFHTPAERDFLHHLLPGSCRLIVCPARRLEGMRVPAAWQKAIAAERMLLLSPFTAESQRRQSARLAERRNELVVALADQILLLHAAPASRTAVLVKQATQQGKSLLALPFV
jgi:predicted Rossmann fold nucleotide-binding protein DprA/Smf involved in DNA uptake